MTSYRKNTLVVDFSILPKRPDVDQVEEFLRDFVKLDMADVKNVQLHHLENRVYIEMNDAGVAPRLHKQHHLQHGISYQGVTYHIPIYVDGPITTLRVHDLPPQMANSVILEHMKHYGKVISIENEVWKNYFKGLPNGVRIVRIRLDKAVPSHITVYDQHTYVSQQKTIEPKGADTRCIKNRT